jgi:hypothetical protein
MTDMTDSDNLLTHIVKWLNFVMQVHIKNYFQMKKLNFLIAAFCISAPCFAQIPAVGQYFEPQPKVVTPGSVSESGGVKAPSDAVPLFDGTDLSQWTGTKGAPGWTVHDGMVTVKDKTGDIVTLKEFGDFQLHIEFMHPSDITGEGQMRGNSGIYLQGLYEIQVLETYNNNNKTYVNGQAGAIYTQHAPLVNPLRKPGEWNAFDIVFTAPTFNTDGSYKSNPRVTVLLNGILIHNNVVIYGETVSNTVAKKQKGPIRLQDHGCTVSYRNIWIREL